MSMYVKQPQEPDVLTKGQPPEASTLTTRHSRNQDNQNPGMHLVERVWLYSRKWGLLWLQQIQTKAQISNSQHIWGCSSNHRQDNPLSTIQWTPTPLTILQRLPAECPLLPFRHYLPGVRPNRLAVQSLTAQLQMPNGDQGLCSTGYKSGFSQNCFPGCS